MFTDQFDSFVEDFLSEKLERPLIIVGASKIDDLLFQILSKYFLPAKKGSDDELLKGDQPLATFSSRIKIAYRLGIIDDGFYKVLELVRKIRNLCAHRVEFDIKKSPVRDHVYELRKSITSRKSYELTKARYFPDVNFTTTNELHCVLVTICVILEAINEKVVKTQGIKDTLDISNK